MIRNVDMPHIQQYYPQKSSASRVAILQRPQEEPLVKVLLKLIQSFRSVGKHSCPPCQAGDRFEGTSIWSQGPIGWSVSWIAKGGFRACFRGIDLRCSFQRVSHGKTISTHDWSGRKSPVPLRRQSTDGFGHLRFRVPDSVRFIQDNSLQSWFRGP